jgi:hypothetical protein
VARAPWSVVLLCTLAACSSGSPPDLLDLTDQVAIVGQELTIELMGVDPDGDNLRYTYASDLESAGRAMITSTPSGNGLFRWTPLASDVGMHVFDFTVSDGSHDNTVSITIDVRSSGGGVPVFREPLSTGRVVDLSAMACVTVDILIDDDDSASVTIAEEAPKIDGATLEQTDGKSATWNWCPTQAQIGQSDRYTLTLSADDGDGHKTIKNYVLVLNGNPQRLIINEIDYDNTGTDMFEYVEVYNPSDKEVALEGLWVVFVNGATSAEYNAAYLGEYETLPAHTYLLVGGAGVDVPEGTYKIDPGWTTDAIENGAPDGVAIIDDVTLTVLDALSYEGSITQASIIGFETTVSLVEGTPLDPSIHDSDTMAQTMCRFPDGTDTNNAATDWTLCNVRTKAAPNIQ